MIIRADQQTIVLDRSGATGSRIGTEQGCEYVKLELAPGAEIPEHILDMPVTFYVLQGEGTALLQGEKITAYQGDLITVTAGNSRGWKNTSKKQLEILVIKHINHERKLT